MPDTLIYYEKNRAVVSAGFSEGKMVSFSVEARDNAYKIGDIYVGRVTKILLHIRAAYVDIGMPVPCYMELIPDFPYITDMTHPDGQLHVGDCIPVQIHKEAVRKKPVTVTPEVSFSNRLFFVKYTGRKGLGFSSKIKDNGFKKHMKERFFPSVPEGMNVLFRTNSYTASEEELEKELCEDLALLKKIIDSSCTRKARTQLYGALPEYIVNLRDNGKLSCEKIITDSPDIFLRLKDYLGERQPELLPNLSFYSDKVLSLECLYDMKKNISGLVSERVWLKSGAHIVIEQTEALVSVDVNTAKASAGKKNFSEGFLKINLEAAEEIFRQITLRDLSGIIIVDFISMKGADSEILLKKVEEISRRYKNITVVDITKLGLVEMTRNRIHQPVKERIYQYGLLEKRQAPDSGEIM